MPDNQWSVVVGSYAKSEGALADLAEIQKRFPNRFQAIVCEPLGGPDIRYRVVIGRYLSYADATKLKMDAIGAGLSPDTWVWNPFDMKKSIYQ